MANEITALMQDVLASPLGDVIASVGRGVAEAQQALDEGSVAKTLEIYREGGDAMIAILRDIGYRPTFYVLPETTGEVAVSLRLSGGNTQSAAASTPAARALNPAIAARAAPAVRTYVTPVDAAFANRYSYNATASAKLVFKIVPVPPPEGMDRARVMPDLTGRKIGEALLVLDMLDLPARIVDKSGNAVAEPDKNAVVNQTAPEASAIVTTSDEVVVTLK
ncbi:MAG: PASTA domain-containing protein [Pseudomonadota bacterium]